MIRLGQRVTTADMRQAPFDGMRGPTLVVAGVNGRLAVERLQLVLPPLLVDMPLRGRVVEAAATASPGSFRRQTHADMRRIALVRDSRDGRDERDRTNIIELADLLRTTYPAFHAHGSVVAHGWFTPIDGRAARRFIAYIDPGFETRIALPDDATSLSAAPRGRAAREAAAKRAAAALQGLTRTVMRDTARARSGARSGHGVSALPGVRAGEHSDDPAGAHLRNRARNVFDTRSDGAVPAWVLHLGLDTRPPLERATA